jgi:HK97 family phage major capsid protein
MAEPTTSTVEAVAADIKARLDGIDESIAEKTSDAKLTELVRGFLPDLLEDLSSDEQAEWVRKLRFGKNEGDARLVGSKYARHGMSVSDIEWLHDQQRSIQGQRRTEHDGGAGAYEGPSEELARTFGAISSARYEDNADIEAAELASLEGRGSVELIDAYKRAMDTAESGYGSSLVGAQYVGELWDAPRKLGRVFPLINSFEMTDATAYLPVEADLAEMLFVSESTANNSSNYTTSKTGSNRVTVSAKKFVIHQMWSGELDEDSIIPFVPFLRAQGAKSVAHYADSLVLNGDTTNAGTGNINLDDADPADTKHYLAFDGLRHAALVDNTGNALDAGTLTLADLMTLKGYMVDATYLMDWGHPDNPEDLVFVADPATADKIAQFDEVITVDKFGPSATVLTGQQARVLGHPLVSSIAMSKTEADGKVSTTGGNNTLGQVTAFHRGGFTAGWRRRVQLETERLPASDQTRLVYSLRMGFGRYSPTGAASGIEATATAYNITL